jgi:hypothetical protein
MIPQNVTSRYARHLLVKGRNNEFELLDIKRTYSEVDGLTIGIYYTVLIKAFDKGFKKDAAGVTPEQAVHRALEKHGVTFR